MPSPSASSAPWHECAPHCSAVASRVLPDRRGPSRCDPRRAGLRGRSRTRRRILPPRGGRRRGSKAKRSFTARPHVRGAAPRDRRPPRVHHHERECDARAAFAHLEPCAGSGQGVERQLRDQCNQVEPCRCRQESARSQQREQRPRHEQPSDLVRHVLQPHRIDERQRAAAAPARESDNCRRACASSARDSAAASAAARSNATARSSKTIRHAVEHRAHRRQHVVEQRRRRQRPPARRRSA